MAKPTLDDFLDSTARWGGSHQGIAYELSWHGRSDYSSEGTWCYYLLVTSQQFYPEDWARLRLAHEDKQFAHSWRRHFDYDNFPDLDAHGGWTFGEMETYLAKDGKEHERVKLGCDYAHLFDREGGYYEGREEVERDAKRSIDLLIAMFPRRRLRCDYSGMFDDAEQFYTAKNGKTVHKSKQADLPAGWTEWLPEQTEAA